MAETRIFDKDGKERLPKAPGMPIEFHEADVLRTTFTWEEAAALLKIPAGYAIADCPDLSKALDCGRRPESVKGDLGHAFDSVYDLRGKLEFVDTTSGRKINMVRVCKDCGLAYGRLVL